VAESFENVNEYSGFIKCGAFILLAEKLLASPEDPGSMQSVSQSVTSEALKARYLL
jgi:hypothetical protein